MPATKGTADPFIKMAARAQAKWVKAFHRKLRDIERKSPHGKIHTHKNEDRVAVARKRP